MGNKKTTIITVLAYEVRLDLANSRKKNYR